MSKRRIKSVPGHKQLTTDTQSSVNHNPVMTLDSFQNALARLGFNMPNATEGASYPLTRLSQNYQLMNSLYRSHWIVRKIVDTIPEDMCKNWIKLNTQADPGKIKEVEKVIRRTKTKEKILEGLKWGRLYGGAAGIILLEGQEDLLALPLDYNLVMPGSYKGLLILDRWSGISPGAQTVTDINSTEFGLPEYYQITTQDAKSFIVHHSRLLRFTGNTLPMWERMAEMQWGASVIESVYDELKKRDNTSWNIASLVFLANLRVFKSDMLGETLGLGGEEAQRDLYRTVEAQNHMMNNQSMMFMGTNDSLETHSYAFSGINDIYESFMLDVAGACEIPVTRLFGRAPAGMDATGESDMNNYYDTIEEKQEAYLSPVLDKLLPIIALSTWGAIPDDLDYVYNPLRKADPKENAELSKSISDSIIAVYTAGLISDRTALKELRQQTDVTGMWSNITDEDIAKADDSPDFGGDMPPMGGMMPNFNQPQQMMATDADFKEEDHPRAKNGQFGSGGEKKSDLEASFTESELKALKSYISSGSYFINEKLRDGEELSESDKAMIRDLDSALDKMPCYAGAVTRSLHFISEEKKNEFLRKHEIGAIITYDAYTSTTSGNVYNSDGDVQIFINSISKGKDISSFNEDESEVLFKRGAAFRVVGKKDSKGKTYIMLKEEPNEH